MNVVFSDTSTQQGLFQHVKYITGQSSLSIEDFTRMLNFAVDDYSSIALSADGRAKFDAATYTNEPAGWTQVVAGQRSYTLENSFDQIHKVEIIKDGTRTVVEPIDQRDWKNESLEQTFATNGRPKYYDWDGQQLKLYPATDWSDSGTVDADNPSANASLYVDHSRSAPYFNTTDTTATIGIPRVHHRYLALKVQHAVMMATNDPSITKVEQELTSWEGLERNGRLSGGKIREYYTTRDANTPRRIISKVNPAFRRTFNRTGNRN